MFFRKDYATPGPGIDPDAPEKTGFARFIEIIQLECVTLVKLNLLFVASCLLVVTIPPAIFAMNHIARKMVRDEPVTLFYDYRTAFRTFWKNSYAAFALTGLPLICAGVGAFFYLNRAGTNPMFLMPFVLCSTVFLAALLAAPYVYGLLDAGVELRRTVRLAMVLSFGRPLRAIAAAVTGLGFVLVAVLEIPISLLFLLLIGFSVPCLLANFYIRKLLESVS
ncbi:MAG: YesL family protein [Oscillibacter sp.]|nr:YesL family protein [Oscillibacter sp.]